MKIDDRYIADARERLRKQAQNEATCFSLNDMLRGAQDEVRRLRKENDNLHEKHVRLHKEIVRLTSHLNKMQIEHTWAAGEAKRLTDENERLKADAERLDWISQQYLDDLCMMLVVDADHDGEYYVEGDDGQKGYGLTLRQAIDAARGAK